MYQTIWRHINTRQDSILVTAAKISDHIHTVYICTHVSFHLLSATFWKIDQRVCVCVCERVRE